MIQTLLPVFVKEMPPHDKMADGILYVSMEFEIAIHKCACGCGNIVITPFHSPDTGWTLTVGAGDRITLNPSIGCFSFPCKSHYWVRDNRVIPA